MGPMHRNESSLGLAIESGALGLGLEPSLQDSGCTLWAVRRVAPHPFRAVCWLPRAER